MCQRQLVWSDNMRQLHLCLWTSELGIDHLQHLRKLLGAPPCPGCDALGRSGRALLLRGRQPRIFLMQVSLDVRKSRVIRVQPRREAAFTAF